MRPERIRIADRVFLNLVQTDKFKTDYFSVDFLLPLKKETASMAALLPHVLLRGTEAYPTMEKLSIALDTLYASHLSPTVKRYGDVHAIGFCSYPLDNAYAMDGTDIVGGLLELLRQVLFAPYREDGLLSASYVQSEKKNLCDRIRAQINNKNAYAVTRCREEMCREGETYLPEYGTVEDTEAITPVSLTEFHTSLLETAQVEIYAIGRCEREDMIRTFTAMFASVPRKTASLPSTAVIRHAEGEVRSVTEEQPVKQGKLSLGFRTDCLLSESDYAEFALLREVLAGSVTSKFFVNVREKLSLCYYCAALPDPHRGILIVTSGIDVANAERAREAILAEVDACRRGDMTEEEIGNAKRSLINSYGELADDAGAIKGWYLNRAMAGRCDSPEDAIQAVAAVTVGQLREKACRLSLDTVYFLKGTLLSSSEEEEEEEDV